MKGIAINGILLHEVRMLTVPYQKGAISYLSYPKSMIDFKVEGQEIQVSVPAMLAVELYRTGIIPQNAQDSFPVSISGKKVGQYHVVDFRYPAPGGPSAGARRDSISISLSKEIVE